MLMSSLNKAQFTSQEFMVYNALVLSPFSCPVCSDYDQQCTRVLKLLPANSRAKTNCKSL